MGAHVSRTLDTATQHHSYPGDSLHIVASREVEPGGLLGAPDTMHDLSYTLLRIVQKPLFAANSSGAQCVQMVDMVNAMRIPSGH